MSANLEAKKQIVEEIKTRIQNANSIIFGDFKGISVVQDTKLRNEFRKNNVEYKVYKNRLIVRALNELGITGFDEKMFEGNTCVATGADEILPAKIFVSKIAEFKKMNVKFGIVNGKVINAQEVDSLAKIPNKETLIAMLLCVLNGPVSALARALNEIAKKQSA